MPAQGGPGGPLRYASSRARQTGTTGAATASLLREISGQTSPDRNASSGRSDPGASLDMPSSQDALPSRGVNSLRDALSSLEGLASRNAVLSSDTLPLRPTLLPEPPLASAKTLIFA